MSAWRHVRAIALLPGTVAVVVPAILLAGGDWDFEPLPALIGAPLIAAGFALWLWTVRLFAVINYVFFLAYEEPAVERRFGDEYRRYKQNVPRWIPRRTPWRGRWSRIAP